ncbi:hypothetical protein HanIR_Chr07g0306861 [Helianthus annuus]|nr:hypothetical protein HanIR_Chr07g0306861 [Helianthus annuus]
MAASFENLLVSLIARKCADLVKPSTITQMVSFPLWDLGKPVTKSMEICSHFHVSISGCCSNPDGLWYSILTLAQVKHLLTYFAMIAFMLGHQYKALRTWYILSEPGCIE